MSGIKAGQLRHRVVLQKKTLEQNPINGEMLEAWSEFATVWAKITPLSVRDFIASATENYQVKARILIRYREDIEPGNKVLHRCKAYRVVGIQEDNRSGLEYMNLVVTAEEK